MPFSALSVALGVSLAVAGLAVWRGRVPNSEQAVRLPRARTAGEFIGVVCLIWSAYHGCLMLEGGLASYRKLVWALVPVTAVLAYGHLDYLFARALGGLLVLCASALVHGAFSESVPLRGLYSVVCYLAGVGGMVLIAVPWRFRDLLLALARGVRWRRPLGVVAMAAGVVLTVLPFLPKAR